MTKLLFYRKLSTEVVNSHILELAQNAHSLYVTQDSWEQRKILDLIHSNSVLKGGKVYMELRKPFDMLADGIVLEEKLKREKAPKEAINKIWLGRQDVLRTFLLEIEKLAA